MASLYKVQVWDEDCESWQDDDECQPASRFDAEDDAREIRRKCAYPVKTRVVAAD
ncbi:MAG: hypothetical protein Q8J78_06720 [Moraxellaceae bacterium]|nr:hypothetical protein [Moraxellaceae bacterium]